MLYGNVIISSVESSIKIVLLFFLSNINIIIPKLNPNLTPQPVIISYWAKFNEKWQ